MAQFNKTKQEIDVARNANKQEDFKRNNGPQMGGRGGRYVIKEKPKDMKKSLKRVIKYVMNFKGLFILLILCVLITNLLNLSTNVFIEKIVDALGSYNLELGNWNYEPNPEVFKTNLILLVVVCLLFCIFRYVGSMTNSYLSNKLLVKMREDLFNRTVKLPISYLDTHKHGDIMSRLINDTDTITTAVSSSIESLIGGVITLVGCLCLMIYYSPLLSVVCIIVLLLTVLSTGLISKFMTPLHKKQHAILGRLNAETEEMVSGSKTVIAYNQQQRALEKFAKESDEMTRVGTKAQIIGGSMGPMMNFVGNIGYFLVCVFGALFVLNNIGGGLFGDALKISVVVTFLHTVKQFNRPINEIAQVYPALVSAIAASERVFELLDEKEEDFTGKLPFSEENIKGVIDFNHIGFSYVPGTPVLRDFNVDVWSGHKIALVGATGSGKTTIVNLLLRFYDIDTGKITIDGVDIADISKRDLRDCISIVLQDPVLFQDTIENNIKYANANATDEEVDAALELANCTNFVNSLPEGKKTLLTEGATNLSQGQRQLLTIARAVLANPKILILDEATSSVDTRTEKKIQDAMVKLMENRTSIIIAHRLSTIQDADLIVVLDQGKVCEMGDHKQLLEKDGVYAKLYNTQFEGNQI